MENSERRIESRFLCADVVHLTCMESRRVRTLEAMLEDISPVGACLQIEEDVPLSTEVALTAGDKTLYGVVSYCAYREYGYFVGIHFCDDTHWSRKVFEPDHLTSIESITGSRPVVG
jgi:hypothetical protein